MNQLKIIMYHYVRNLEQSRYPKIKALRTVEFRSQIDHLAQQYTPVTAQEVIAASRHEAELPPNAVWLTFDDGYLDHYTTVFPILHERGWQGTFFASARPVLERKLLDVNKIHFILATAEDINSVISEIKKHVDANSANLRLTFSELWKAQAIAGRLDTAEVMFIKNLLQHALPLHFRVRVINALFATFVSADERAIASEVYMSQDQIQLMLKCGMFFGSHGNDHSWMGRISTSEQEREVQLSIKFLSAIGAQVTDWIMCYPYGSYDASLIEILQRNGCAIGLTTRRAIADLSRDSPLKLPRLDTNELPI
jgi:peptidoglycan/xylan/chitin deacetylase (PgdA/CDA1 family)